MQVDGQADLVLERGDQLFSRVGFQKAGHILDAQDMRAALFDLLGEVHIVVQRILVTLGVEDIARVADRSLAQLALVEYLVHRDLHAGQPVERVEYAEHVNAGLCGFLDERAHQIVRVVGIAHKARAAQQHLEWDVRDLLAQQLEALPRRLVQEAIGRVERRAAPAFEREAVIQDLRRAARRADHIAGAHTGRKQGLVRVAHGGVRDEQALFMQHIVLDRLRPLAV